MKNDSCIKLEKTKFEGNLYDEIYKLFNDHAYEKTNIKNYWNDEICITATIDNKFAGVIVYAICGGQLWIYQLFLKKEFRGHGIGKTLLENAISYAKEQNCDFIYLETMSFQNVDFYKNFGFKEDFIRPGFKHNESWIYMSKRLK